MTEHRHRFKPITEWSKTGPPFFQTIVGWEPCECGVTKAEAGRERRNPVRSAAHRAARVRK